MDRKVWLSVFTRMKITRQRKIRAFFCCFLLGLAPLAQADIAVIVNAANSGTSLKLSEVQSIFLGLQTTLPNGAKVSPLDQGPDQAIREEFYQLVAGKNAVEMKTYWSRASFTGRGTPPQVLPSGSAVLSKVASNKSAIGYVDSSLAKSAGVATVLLIPTH